MASLFTRREAIAAGITDRRLERAVERGRYVRLAQSVYFNADRPPTRFECQLAVAMRSGKPVGGECAAVLHGFDGFDAPLDGHYDNVVRTNALDTLTAIAATTCDVAWEHALEWCLR